MTDVRALEYQLRALERELTRRGVKPPAASPADLLEDVDAELIRRGLPLHRTFREFVEAMNQPWPDRPALLAYEHVPRLVDVLERVVEGALFRVLVMLPPRYFKTELFGKLLAAYYLRRHPRRLVGVSSHTAHRAWEISQAARTNYQRAGGLLGDAQADERWQTAQGGELWALGMGAGITGRGFHLGILDDPIHAEHAHSPAWQRRFRDWWPSVWLSRQEPTPKFPGAETGPQRHAIAQMVVVMQRLGPEDPIDFLFRRELGDKADQAPEHWHVVVMDEIKSDEPLGRWKGPRGLPDTCTLEPDPRPAGTALAPLRFSLETARAAQRSAGPLTAAAQRQQRPMAAEGDFWKLASFGEYQTLPPDAYDGGRDWDTAMTKDEANSATASVLSYRGPSRPREPGQPEEFDVYVEDVDWDHLEFPALVKRMRELTGPHYVEAKASGKNVVQTLAAHGVRAEEVQVTGDKFQRAAAVQPMVSNGRVWINARITQRLLWGQGQGLLRVTAEALQGHGGTAGLDVNDAFVQALTRHLGIGGRRRRVRVFG